MVVAVLVGVVALATVVGIVAADEVVVDFEFYDDGTELVTQYENVGVAFPPQPDQSAGALVVRCGPQNPHCPEAESGRNAAITPLDAEFGREPLVVRFDEPQRAVQVYVRDGAGNEGLQSARLEARDASGRVVDERTVDFEVDTGWHLMTVVTSSPEIEEVTLTLSNVQTGAVHNRLAVDDLQAERPDPVLPIDPWLAAGLGLVGILGLALAVKGVSRWRGNGDGEDGNRPPRPRFAHSPTEPVAGRPVAFDGTASFDPDPEDAVASHEWTIDGEPAAGRRVVHTFDEAGEYDVALTVTDSRGTSDATTETVTVEAGSGALELAEAHPDAPGDDHENLAEEYLVFENVGDGPLDLAGWTVHDAAEAEDRVTEGEHTFGFPDGVELDPDETVAVHTGSEPDEDPGTADRHCYWGRDWAVWNNERDVIVVEDERGEPVVAVRYERTESGEYDREELGVASLSDWFTPVEAATAEGIAPELPSVDIEVESTVLTRLGDLAAGVAFLRGPRRAVVSWAILAGVGYLTGLTALWTASEVLLAVAVLWAISRYVRSRG